MKFFYQLLLLGLLIFFLFIKASILNAQTPNNQDCLGAIPVCQNSYHQGNSFSGTGNYPAEIPTTGGCPGNCMLAGERNDVWYTFTVQNSGWLNFSIDPVSSSDDYDWALYNLTTDNCSSILNLAAAPYLQVSCNWSADPGLTGANSLSPNTGGSCGGASDAQNNVQVWVNSGQTFYLNISNYSSTQYGYDLDFNASTAQIFDNIPPYLLSFINPVCGATSITVTFSENVLCSTVQPGDFTITGPGGISVTSVYGAACAVGATNENIYTLNLSSSLQIGTYTLCLNGSAGNVSDNCGNMSDPSNPLNCKTFTISGSSVTVSPSSASLCSGQSVSLSASGAANFSWAPSAGLSCTNCPNPTANPNSTTTYTVSGVTGSCNNGNATVTINVSPNPSVSINSTPSPPVVCNGDSISLTANSSISGSTYQWSTGQTSQTISGIPPVSDTLYVTVTTPASCSASASIIYTVNPTPVLTVSTVPSAICYGQSSTLTASGAANYNWQPGNLNGAVVNVTPNTTTTYTVTGTSSNGCSSSSTVTVTVNTNPVVFASSSSTVICSGQCTTLDASGAATYTWQPGNLTGTSVNVCPSTTTTYTLTGSTTAGCTNSSSIIITVNPTPALNASATPNTLCNGQCTNLNATGATTYTWQPGNLNGSTVNVCPNTTTNYTLTGSSTAGCSSTANVNVTVNPLPTVSISSATNVLCNGQCTNLNASGASTYIWQPGNLSGSTINACPATSVIYTLTGTNAFNCSSTDTIAIIVNPNPILTVTPSTSTVCLNDCSQLTAGGASTYSWTGAGVSPASGAIVNACPSSTTTYTITGTNSYNCTSTITATVNVNPNLNITVSPPGTAICTGDSALLTLSPTATYTWTPSTNISSAGSNSFYAFPVSTTTYYINGVNSYGCSGSDTIVITVNPIPTSDFTVTSPVCNPDSSYFEYTGTAGPGATFNWNFNSGNAIPAGGFQDYYVHWVNPGIYQTTLIVTENNCTSSSTNNTVVISSVNAAASVLNNVSCNGLSDGLATVNTTDGIPPYIFHWNTIPPQNTQQADSLAAGSYIVTVIDSAGCISTDTVIISEPLVLIADTISLQHVNCFGGNNGNINVTANGGTPPYAYNWSNGASGSSNNNLIAGNYTLTVTDNNNCTATLQVSIYEPPKLNLLLDVINESCENYCDGSIIVHSSGGTLPYQYLWNPASGNDSIAGALCNGFYSVTVTDNNLCQADTQCQIITMNIMFADATADPDHSSINIPVNFYFTGTPANVYHWDFGDGSVSTDQNPVHTYMADGTYTVILTVSSGAPYYCEDVFILTIVVYTPSSLDIPNVFTPNGDGYNDVFKLKSFGLKTEVMSIYNRWGKKIYEWNEPGGQWDGTTEHGAKCSDGTYYYILKASGYDGLEYNFEGTITLIK